MREDQEGKIHGFLTRIKGEVFYCIENFHLMEPFLMSIVSSSDLWMYLSSSGSLTAGRNNYDNTLFPYDTDDKIHASAANTGPVTLIAIKTGAETHIWEPFSSYPEGKYRIQRNLYKNMAGNQVIFEEINQDLQMRFSYCWMSSDSLGWIRECNLENLSEKSLDVSLSDGLQNLLPHGITRQSQALMSTLMDAYKIAEWDAEARMALYYLSSIPVDRAEPSEALRANCLWYHGPGPAGVQLGTKHLQQSLKIVKPQTKLCGQKTSFFVHLEEALQEAGTLSWYMIADVGLDSSEVLARRNLILKEGNFPLLIQDRISRSSRKLQQLVTLADGLQKSGDPLNDRRHFANVMFNIMRGGIFEKEYLIDTLDLKDHIEESSKPVLRANDSFFSPLPAVLNLRDLLQKVRQQGDWDITRLVMEYLPLSFSRRHGDPSRPWNYFDIRVKNADGSPSLNYQGNWRDIFQNWEALAFSFPAFLPGMICRFLNASTADGYNPYRITRQGFDWEVPEPDNPWAYIGYWGDHQLIYLLRLLEMFESFFPGQMEMVFGEKIFVYARVPYRIKDYYSILNNPRDTIIFEKELHASLMERSRQIGADGKLMQHEGNLLRAGFIEKILVMLLTKLGNFVPQAGIWLNTQRPEWNDANNALVGAGASVVTLCHLRRFCDFLNKMLSRRFPLEMELTSEVFDFWLSVNKILSQNRQFSETGPGAGERKIITDQLGLAAQQYRQRVYYGFSGKSKSIRKAELQDSLGVAIAFCDQSIAANRRDDGLYHSYNLLAFSSKSIEIQQLSLMLEGQVAYLSSGLARPEETIRIIRALFEGPLFRENQQSFMLYPYRELPGFLEKNIIPPSLVDSSVLLRKLADEKTNSIIKQDCRGIYHFGAELINARHLEEALEGYSVDMEAEQLKREKALIHEIYEMVFRHRFFTGRSGSFFKYEGLGSIYWHMVSKLLLALGENIILFSLDERNHKYNDVLKDFYFKIRKGIGIHKTPEEYGAFPTDPYSHTPANMGAQQPGMTGQVKEDIRSRFNELGIIIHNGQISIIPVLLNPDDFTESQPGEIVFSFCGTEFIYRKTGQKLLEVHWQQSEQEPLYIHSYSLPADVSAQIFEREKSIQKVVVHLKI